MTAIRADVPTALDLAISSGAQHLRARLGQTIFYEGDPSDAVYVLIEGEVRSFVSRAEDTNAKTTLLLRAPALFGDRDVLTGTSARETTVCLTPSRLLSWPSDTFFEAWTADTNLRSLVAQDLAARYTRTLELAALQLSPLVDFVQAVLRDRELRGDHARPKAADLAPITGAAPKTVARALARLRKLQVTTAPTQIFHSLSGRE